MSSSSLGVMKGVWFNGRFFDNAITGWGLRIFFPLVALIPWQAAAGGQQRATEAV